MRPRGHKTWVEISRSALLANLRQVRVLVSPAKVMCVIKANAYGHGMVEVAQICERATDWFGVDTIDDAIVLRRKRVRKPILVIGYIVPERLSEAIALDCAFVVYTKEMLTAVVQVAKQKRRKARIHLKLETGLMRQGVSEQDLPAMLAYIRRHERYLTLEGVSTHYANIEDTVNAAFAREQLQRFEQGVTVLESQGFYPAWKHTAATAAAMVFPEMRFNLIRLGIALYGLWPSEKTRQVFERQEQSIKLQPVLTWKTMVVQVKQVPSGSSVGYGLTERVERDSRVAVLPIGYWDGYDRVGMSRQAHVLIRGKRCKILGRICMNICMVDVTEVRGVKEGDEVVILGKQKGERVSAEELAELANTIAYETVTRINPTIVRIVTK